MSSHHDSAYHGDILRMPSRTPAGLRRREVGSPALQGARKPRSSDEIWGRYNNYRANGLAVSALVHLGLIGLLLSGIFVTHQITQRQAHETVTLIAPSPETYVLPASKKITSGGGGGGDRDVIPAPKGHPPKLAVQQITPPTIVIRNDKPKLAVAPSVVVPPTVHLADNHMPNIGLAAPAVMPAAPPSNGTGSGGGIGSGSGGGLGMGHGSGIGSGIGAGVGGGVYRVGGGISAPTAISAPDPDYTEQARRAKKQGTCVLWLIVDSSGHPRDIRVVRGLGFGLDAKAIDAVKQWRFQPALKDGTPVDVQISVNIDFHLY
ncbi:MAG TPA: energy transducer TonB [Candidatus Acidoferrales bacterium]|nr:energy transducer TonB [Candidatus Acidoferrales bacterium]